MTAVHVTVWDEAGGGAPAVVLVPGTMTWGTACFEAQRPLARHYRLLVLVRRVFGESPDIDRSDYEVDALDVVELLGDGVHLVGHSYGGVVAMLAAGCALAHPDRALGPPPRGARPVRSCRFGADAEGSLEPS